MRLEFGYLPKAVDVGGSDWSIATLPGLAEKEAWVRGHPNIRQGEFYPGNRQWEEQPSRKISEDPFSIRIFGLPKTHVLSLDASDDPEQLKFVIWVLSFFKGMRLTSESAGFIDATPISEGSLVDFHFRGKVESIVALAQAFWLRERGDPWQAKRLVAAIHALFLAQRPNLMEFEKFVLTYAALDACYRFLHPSTKDEIRHTDRIKWMCARTGVPAPPWAEARLKEKGVEISILRNATFHEALYLNEPFGFASSDPGSPTLPQEMTNLVCRIVAVILGITDTEYLNISTRVLARKGLRL